MPRPLKCRRIGFQPSAGFFEPRGVHADPRDEVRLTMDELEAVRLADGEGLYHDAAARRMRVSRQTFGNILGSARGKIADGLINSKAIRIEGGHYQLAPIRTFHCLNCRRVFKVPTGTSKPRSCPGCRSRSFCRGGRNASGNGPAGPSLKHYPSGGSE
jgi:predicted DNA-binding protein (UPF0251 family)